MIFIQVFGAPVLISAEPELGRFRALLTIAIVIGLLPIQGVVIFRYLAFRAGSTASKDGTRMAIGYLWAATFSSYAGVLVGAFALIGLPFVGLGHPSVSILSIGYILTLIVAANGTGRQRLQHSSTLAQTKSLG